MHCSNGDMPVRDVLKSASGIENLRAWGLIMEFHISRAARQRYQFEDSLFSFNGNVVFADLAACRAFAHRMNQVRESDQYPDRAVHAGQLFAMGLIDEASHVLMAHYREQFDPDVMNGALDWFGGQVGRQELDKLLLTFVEHFPGSDRDARRGDTAAMARRLNRQHVASRRRP